VLTFGCPPAVHALIFSFLALSSGGRYIELFWLSVDLSWLVVVILFQIRSVEAVHRFFEKFPEAFMDKLHVPVPKRFSMFSQFIFHTSFQCT